MFALSLIFNANKGQAAGMTLYYRVGGGKPGAEFTKRKLGLVSGGCTAPGRQMFPAELDQASGLWLWHPKSWRTPTGVP